jgi:predicted amidohydrolase YtcJ
VTGTGITGARVNQAALDALGLGAGDEGVEVDGDGNPTGGISGAASTAAGDAIVAQLDQLGIQGEADCLSDFLDDAVKNGLTSIKDAGGNTFPWGTTGAITDGLHGEEPAMHLYRTEGLPVRIAYHQMSGYEGPAAAIANLRNAVGFLGDDWFRYLGPGEDTMATDPGYSDFTTLAARKRVSVETHVGDIDAILTGFEAADEVAPIDDLVWRIAHPEDGEPTDEQIARAKALDAGWILTFSTVRNGGTGPRYKSVLDSGARFCLAADAMNVAPWKPFQNLWYVTTGRTLIPGVRGVPAEQRLSRLEALRHQTVDCAWTMGQQGNVGSLRVGRFADLLVLNKDYFTIPKRQIRTVKPVLTVVGGDVKHASGPYRTLD